MRVCIKEYLLFFKGNVQCSSVAKGYEERRESNIFQQRCIPELAWFSVRLVRGIMMHFTEMMRTTKTDK